MTYWDERGQRDHDHSCHHRLGPYPAHSVDSSTEHVVNRLGCHLNAVSDCGTVLGVDQCHSASGEVVFCPKFLPVTYSETGVVKAPHGRYEYKELPHVSVQRSSFTCLSACWRYWESTCFSLLLLLLLGSVLLDWLDTLCYLFANHIQHGLRIKLSIIHSKLTIYLYQIKPLLSRGFLARPLGQFGLVYSTEPPQEALPLATHRH